MRGKAGWLHNTGTAAILAKSYPFGPMKRRQKRTRSRESGVLVGNNSGSSNLVVLSVVGSWVPAALRGLHDHVALLKRTFSAARAGRMKWRNASAGSDHRLRTTDGMLLKSTTSKTSTPNT
jgi:hypothetical protein